MYLVWTLISVSLMVALAFGGDTVAKECVELETCDCGIKVKVWYGANSGVMMLLSLARLAAWLEVSKKFSSRKASKNLDRKLSVIFIGVQIMISIYGVIIFVFDSASEHCETMSSNFNSLLKLTEVFICVMLLVNFVYTFICFKEIY
jgi:hypothetical protein